MDTKECGMHDGHGKMQDVRKTWMATKERPQKEGWYAHHESEKRSAMWEVTWMGEDASMREDASVQGNEEASVQGNEDKTHTRVAKHGAFEACMQKTRDARMRLSGCGRGFDKLTFVGAARIKNEFWTFALGLEFLHK